MTDDGATPLELEDLVGEVRDLAYRHAQSSLSAQQVRRHGLRRRRTRRGAVAGTGAFALASAVIVVVLAGGRTPGTVVPPAGGHPVQATAKSTAPRTPGPRHTPKPAGVPSSIALPPSASASALMSTSTSPSASAMFTPAGPDATSNG
jgi:hypothetical protein